MSMSKYHRAENTNTRPEKGSWWALRPWGQTGGHATPATLGASLAGYLGCTAEWKYSTGGNK